MTFTTVWVVTHNNEQPWFFTSENKAYNFACDLLEKKTNNFDGSHWIDRDSILNVCGYYLNNDQSPAMVAISNLYTEEKISKNNEIFLKSIKVP